MCGPNNSVLIGGSMEKYSNNHSKAQVNHTCGAAEGLNPERLTKQSGSSGGEATYTHTHTHTESKKTQITQGVTVER